MQVSTLSAHMVVGSELVCWYRDSTLVPYGPLLIDWSPRTDNRLRFCTNSGSVPSKFFIQNPLKQLELCTMNTHNLSNIQVFQVNFRKCKRLFHQFCPKEFVQFLCIVNLLKRNLQRKKRRHVAEFPSEGQLCSLN